MKRMVIVVSMMVLAVCQGVAGVHSSVAAVSAFLPDPHLFKLRAKSFPWHTDFLLDARVENNTRAEKDGDVIYDPTTGLPHWSKLGRVTGWYEDALMHKGKLKPAVDILVSEFHTSAAAHNAYLTELRGENYRPAKSHPRLGSESTEFASSDILGTGKNRQRVEDSTIYVRYQNLEVDVAVYDVHGPKYHWDAQYRSAAHTLASRMTALARKALATAPTPTPSPTATSTASPSPMPTSTVTSVRASN